MSAKQKNTSEAPRKRGRPKKVGELKESSVRIRPALKEKLEAAAGRSGESIARELENRLEQTFSGPPMREPTRLLLERLAAEINEVEEAGRRLDPKAATWNQSLTLWAIVREVLANGPILETIPHPKPELASELAAMNTKLKALTVERDAISRSLLVGGVMPLEAAAVLGAKFLGYRSNPDRSEQREAIEARDDLPADIREMMLKQVERLEALDNEIDTLTNDIKRAMVPYIEARQAARRFIYDANGIPDLPIWLTAPVGLDEQPPRRSPLPERGQR